MSGRQRQLQRTLNCTIEGCCVFIFVYRLVSSFFSIELVLLKKTSQIKAVKHNKRKSIKKTRICHHIFNRFCFQVIKKTQNTSLLLFSALFSESFVENLFNFFTKKLYFYLLINKNKSR